MDNQSLREQLQKKQQFLKKTRLFFEEKKLIEVNTNHLSMAAGTDVHIRPWTTINNQNQRWFLHTSPEFAMKKLLAQNSGDIFQICQVYRDESVGNWHNQEFQMLEWYRVNWSLEQLIAEVLELIYSTGKQFSTNHYSILEIFNEKANWNPWQPGAISQAKKSFPNGPSGNCMATWFDYILVEKIEPALKNKELVILYDYPPSHAALAKTIKKGKRHIAKRFEVYLHGIEIANGFLELTDPVEQKNRFNNEIEQRKKLNLPCWPIDDEFLTSMQTLPSCSGVALGLDRLFALLNNNRSIN